MATLAAAMLVAFGVLTLFVRVAIQLRRTGQHRPDRSAQGRRPARSGSERDPLRRRHGDGGRLRDSSCSRTTLDPIGPLDVDALHVLGIALAALGGLAVFLAQLGMGASWRIGVSDDQGTDLVTGGWFSWVRNPIYSTMIVGWIGFALMVPTWLAFAAVVVIALGLELQVRFVEEPYLRRTHGSEYGAYASRVGRFVPGFGRSR